MVVLRNPLQLLVQSVNCKVVKISMNFPRRTISEQAFRSIVISTDLSVTKNFSEVNYFCNILPVLRASKIIRNRKLVEGGCTWQRSSIAKLIFGVGSKVAAPHRNFLSKMFLSWNLFFPFQVSKFKKIQNTHEADLFKYEPFPASFGFSPPFLLHFDKFYICKCR